MRQSITLCILFLLFFSDVKGQLQVTTNITNTTLVQQHLLGPGVCAKNIRWTGLQNQRARFTCTNNCNVGFSSGILITSGTAATATGTNTNGGAGADINLPGDPDLNQLVPGNVSADAGVLEFDFSVPADSIQFRFVFASEEYNDFVNTNCNDVFGFFISGPGYVGNQNIALIPGTTTGITINNVNNGNSGTGIVPTGPCSNCAYYRDNTGGIGTQYDGMTVVLTASAAVRPCTMYHFKMGVQDNCDGVFDSGVFLEANSFQATGEIPLYVGNDTLNSNDTIFICPGDTLVVALPTGPNPLWSNGSTADSIVITQPGTYYGTVSDTCCFAFSVFLNVQWQPQAAAVVAQGPTTFCNGDSVLLLATPTGSNLTYLWSNGATTSSIQVKNSGNYSVTVGSGGNCNAVSTPIQVSVNSNPISLIAAGGPTTFCTGSSVILSSSNPANSYQWSTGQTTSAITVTNAGAYTLTLSDLGCTSTSTVNVIVNNPTPVAITTPALPCTGNPGILNATAGFAGYSWNTSATTAQINVSASAVYSVTATDINGCTSAAQFNYAPLPFTPPVISSPVGFCAGQTTSLLCSVGYSSYLWSNGNVNQNNQISSGGTYTVTVTAANGCTGTTSSTVAQWPLPIPVITGVFSVCDGTPANLTAGPAGLIYAWSSGATTQIINPITAGAYTVTVADNNGCSASATQLLIVNTAPVVTVTGDFDACPGDQGFMSATPGFAGYSWSNGSSSNSISPSTQGWYYVTVTDFGCTSLDSAYFTVLPLPQPAFSGIPAFCPGLTTSISVSQPFNSYLWSDGSTTASVTINTPGNYSVTVTDANSCLNSASISIAQWPSPQPILPASAAICMNGVYLLQPGSFQSYLWSDNSTASSLNITTSGTYSVTVTDNNGCTGSAVSNLVVNPAPTPVITGPASICSGQLAVLNAGNFNSYIWSDGSTGAQLATTAAGTYTVTVTDANGCTNSTFASLIVYPSPLVAITGPQNFCDGGTVTIETIAGQGTYLWSNGSATNSTTVNSSGNYQVTATSAFGCTTTNSYTVNERPEPQVDFSIQQSPACNEILVQFVNSTVAEQGTTYFWEFGDNKTSIKTAPQHSYYTPGDYTVKLYATSPYGCKSDDTLTFNVDFPPAPIASFTFSPDIVSIYNSTIRFSNTSQNAVRYKWNFGNGQFSDEINPVHTFDRVGEQMITLFAYNSEACYDEYQLPIEVVPFWVPNAFTPNNDGKNDYFFEADYTLNIQAFTMQIFDRWGKQIYFTDSFSKPWDGNVDGTPAMNGIYTYLISVTSLSNKKTEFKGTFNLVR
jgi:gliding motility-associated-like protein